MRKIFLSAIIFCFCLSVSAQKYVPVIKAGTVLTYDAYSRGLGQHIAVTITILNLTGDTIKMQWHVDDYGTGIFAISAKALECGTKLVIRQPGPNGVTTLKDDETLAVLSKVTFNNLINDKMFQLNGQRYFVSADTVLSKLNDKTADVFHAMAENGKSEIWVLNIPYFPLVYHGKSITRGVDVTLTGVKE